MSTQELYYIPVIEEFHVGFEFEELELGSREKFNKVILDEWDGLSGDYDGMTDLYEIARGRKKVRVKYLDKEDIESFGFVFDKTSDGGQWKFFKGNLCLFYRPETKELGTFTPDPSKSDFMMEYVVDNKHIRFLIIRNKSELKVLLKQLREC